MTLAYLPWAAIRHELVARFGDEFTDPQIDAFIDAAAYDLAGSVSAESLPEMAVRLAAARLERSVQGGLRQGSFGLA